LHDEKLHNEFVNAVVAIEKCVNEVKPDIIYTHHKGDSNQDHSAAFNATIVAARTTNKHKVGKILCYEVPSSTEQGAPFVGNIFIPNVFIDITKTLDKKIAALKEYKSEIRPFPHPRSIKAIVNLAENRGVSAGLKAAESFSLVREIDS